MISRLRFGHACPGVWALAGQAISMIQIARLNTLILDMVGILFSRPSLPTQKRQPNSHHQTQLLRLAPV